MTLNYVLKINLYKNYFKKSIKSIKIFNEDIGNIRKSSPNLRKNPILFFCVLFLILSKPLDNIHYLELDG
jgi:hypothetical protein